MVSEIRLAGRRLLIGAEGLSRLTLAVGIMLVLSLSLMPAAYEMAAEMYLADVELVPALSLAVSFFLMLITFMSFIALKSGNDRYMLKKAQGIAASAKDIFYYFKPRELLRLSYMKIRLLILRLSLFAVLNIPAMLSAGLLVSLSDGRVPLSAAAVLLCGTLAFLVSGTLFYMRVSASLFLAEYYYIKGEYLSFSHLVASSQNAMKGRGAELFRLRLSFWGWFFSCILLVTAGYVAGYYRQTLAAYADKIMKLQ